MKIIVTIFLSMSRAENRENGVKFQALTSLPAALPFFHLRFTFLFLCTQSDAVIKQNMPWMLRKFLHIIKLIISIC